MKILNLKLINISIITIFLINLFLSSLANAQEKNDNDSLNTIESYYWIGLEDKGNSDLFLNALNKIKQLEKENSEEIKEIPVEELPKWMYPAFEARNKDGEIFFTTEKFNKVASEYETQSRVIARIAWENHCIYHS